MKTNKIEKKVLILFGSTLLSDYDLIIQLKRFFEVIPCEKENKLLSICKKRTIHIILIEVSYDRSIFDLLLKIHDEYPAIPTIATGNKGYGEIAAQAFFVGVWDYFKIPYHRDLLVERAKALAIKT